ncbi:MAG: zinc ribbon domain-containing protein [Candidatus Handelsmanbacteria bacterium]|nr:zinc ribbon domain-containing protein [Candidatus Handelsmanbacteria bacterium]
MPTYEYQCQKCGTTFETFQSIKDAPLEKCTKKGCRGKVRRLIGAGGGLLFKGSGFYITDYRSEGYKKAAKAGESAGSGASTSSSGESKPAAAATPAAS